MATRISIKQLHQTTGEHVRRAAESSTPIQVTDRGKPVAVLTRPALLLRKRRRRTLLPEYKALLSRASTGDVLDDLTAVRGDR
jgi:prevent-host-death family protein